MSKYALLVGVSEYSGGMKPLSKVLRDIDELAKLLVHSEIGAFDKVKVLPNPNKTELEDILESLFKECERDDLIVFYYSGHAVKDDFGKLYLTNYETRKDVQGRLVKASATSAGHIEDILSDSPSKRQVLIFDCCYSAAIARSWSIKDDGSVNIEDELGKQGRVVLASSSSAQFSFQSDEEGGSIYTRQLISGLRTGMADSNKDGWISVDELHQFAIEKLTVPVRRMKPELIPFKEGYNIRLARTASKEIDMASCSYSIIETKHFIRERAAQARIAHEQEQARIAHEQEQVRIAGEQEQVRIAGEQEQVRIAGEQEQVRIAGEQEQVRIAGEQEQSPNTRETNKRGLQWRLISAIAWLTPTAVLFGLALVFSLSGHFFANPSEPTAFLPNPKTPSQKTSQTPQPLDSTTLTPNARSGISLIDQMIEYEQGYDNAKSPAATAELQEQLDATYSRLKQSTFFETEDPEMTEKYRALYQKASDEYGEGLKSFDRGNGKKAEEFFATALKHFTELTKIDPKQAKGFRGKGDCEEALTHDDQALIDFKTGLMLEPENATLWRNLGNLFAFNGEKEKSVASFVLSSKLSLKSRLAAFETTSPEQALERESWAQEQVRVAMPIIGAYLIEQLIAAEVTKSNENLNLLLKRFVLLNKDNAPGDGVKIRNQGFAVRRENPLAARNLYYQALTQNPTDDVCWSNLALLYANEEKLPQARACLTLSYRLAPENSNPIKNLESLKSLGDSPTIKLAAYQALGLIETGIVTRYLQN